MTTVIVQHTRMDLLRLALYAALRSPTLRWTLLALAVALLAINLRQQQGHLGLITWVAIVLTTGLFSAGAVVFMLILTVLSTLLRNRKGSPAAEVHTYSLTDDGLARHSASSVMLLKWGGARTYCWEQCLEEARCTGTRWAVVAGSIAGQCQLISGPLSFIEPHEIKTEDGQQIRVIASRKAARQAPQ